MQPFGSAAAKQLVFRNFQTIHYIDSINHESTNHAAFVLLLQRLLRLIDNRFKMRLPSVMASRPVCLDYLI